MQQDEMHGAQSKKNHLEGIGLVGNLPLKSILM
jgi:hypothetical protein